MTDATSSATLTSSAFISTLLYLTQARLAALGLEYAEVASRHGWISKASS
jgi:hypothetical protein